MIRLYWDIGKIIVEAQKTRGYGKPVMERLAKDPQKEFPGTAGCSPQSVWFMRGFYLAWLTGPTKHPPRRAGLQYHNYPNISERI